MSCHSTALLAWMLPILAMCLSEDTLATGALGSGYEITDEALLLQMPNGDAKAELKHHSTRKSHGAAASREKAKAKGKALAEAQQEADAKIANEEQAKATLAAAQRAQEAVDNKTKLDASLQKLEDEKSEAEREATKQKEAQQAAAEAAHKAEASLAAAMAQAQMAEQRQQTAQAEHERLSGEHAAAEARWKLARDNATAAKVDASSAASEAEKADATHAKVLKDTLAKKSSIAHDNKRIAGAAKAKSQTLEQQEAKLAAQQKAKVDALVKSAAKAKLKAESEANARGHEVAQGKPALKATDAELHRAAAQREKAQEDAEKAKQDEADLVELRSNAADKVELQSHAIQQAKASLAKAVDVSQKLEKDYSEQSDKIQAAEKAEADAAETAKFLAGKEEGELKRLDDAMNKHDEALRGERSAHEAWSQAVTMVAAARRPATNEMEESLKTEGIAMDRISMGLDQVRQAQKANGVDGMPATLLQVDPETTTLVLR